MVGSEDYVCQGDGPDPNETKNQKGKKERPASETVQINLHSDAATAPRADAEDDTSTAAPSERCPRDASTDDDFECQPASGSAGEDVGAGASSSSSAALAEI